MKPRLFLQLLGLGAGFATVGCVESDESNAKMRPDSYPYKVATTVGMITDIVRNVGGEHVAVEGIIGQGVDPHLYLPSTPDVKALRGADIVFYNGLMLEGKMGDVLDKVALSGKPVHAVTTNIEAAGGYVLSDDSNHHDPHVWMDVAGWIKAVEVVKTSLTSYDRVHETDYEKNATAYLEKLRKLDAYARKSIATIPENQRVLVTAHDAFGYMSRAYGIEVRGIQGISTESNAGLRDIEELVDFLVKRKIPSVFVESSVPRKNIMALVEGARAKGHEVRIGGELYSDAMGAAGSYEGTYEGMIDHNVTIITRALGGVAPEKGLNGKLEE